MCIGVGVILMEWWSGLALLAAFLFAGLAQVTDRPVRAPTASDLESSGVRLAEMARYELDSAA